MTSFLLVGIMWLNHHAMLRLIRAADHGLVVANLFVLLTVTVIPFTTKVAGDEIVRGEPADQRTAAALYALGFFAFGVAFSGMWLRAARHRRLIKTNVPDDIVTVQTRRVLLGPPAFALAAAIGLVLPMVSFGLVAALSLLYLLPLMTPRTRHG